MGKFVQENDQDAERLQGCAAPEGEDQCDEDQQLLAVFEEGRGALYHGVSRARNMVLRCVAALSKRS